MILTLQDALLVTLLALHKIVVDEEYNFCTGHLALAITVDNKDNQDKLFQHLFTTWKLGSIFFAQTNITTLNF